MKSPFRSPFRTPVRQVVYNRLFKYRGKFDLLIKILMLIMFVAGISLVDKKTNVAAGVVLILMAVIALISRLM